MTTNNWDPAHFEQITRQRAIDAAVGDGIDGIKAEYAKANKYLPLEVEQKLRLTIANQLRANMKRGILIEEVE